MLVMSQSKSTVVNTRHIVKLIVKSGRKTNDKEEAYEYHHIVACESLDTICSGTILAFYPTKEDAQTALYDLLFNYERAERIYCFLTPEELKERSL